MRLLALTHIYLGSNIILSSHLHLGLPRRIFPICLSVNNLKTLLSSPMLALCHAYLNLIDLNTLAILGELYKLWFSSL
jgi:hypothetical protein